MAAQARRQPPRRREKVGLAMPCAPSSGSAGGRRGDADDDEGEAVDASIHDGVTSARSNRVG